ncbi:hypothetical protein VM98_16225 [Streptomyces rubellomurinus subsp. indigoferus]|nr:hypothetical protein VM98_16225 [Streptomyces rubellomurinus subsp. indigoferus]
MSRCPIENGCDRCRVRARRRGWGALPGVGLVRLSTARGGARPAGAGQPPPPGWAAVAPAVRSALAAAPQAAVTVRVPPGLPLVHVGQGALEQALAAVVRAAWLRTPPGARVLVRAGVETGPAGGVRVLRIRVADRGPDLAGEAKVWALGGVPAGGGRITLADNPAGGLVHVLTLPLAE